MTSLLLSLLTAAFVALLTPLMQHVADAIWRRVRRWWASRRTG
jgi:hypothetical protein